MNKLYVRRLKNMLTKQPEDMLTNCCPMYKGHRLFTSRPIKIAQTPFETLEGKWCVKCKDFIDMDTSKGCPCLDLGVPTAVKRAKRNVKQWDKGEHKWQK